MGLLVAVLWLASAPGLALPPLPAESHPGLLFTAEQVPLLRERCQREPYATWWQMALARARALPATLAAERERARYAETLAFAYLMTDTLRFAEQAAALLQGMRFPPRGGNLGEPHVEGEAVARYALAYDFLHPYLEDKPEALAEIRAILVEEATRLYAGIQVGVFPLTFRLHETPHLDNWHLRVYGGLGLAALALSEYPATAGSAPQDWAERAYDLVVRTLDYQIEAQDGGCAEGPYYLRYAAEVYLPYMFALKNRQGIDLFASSKVEKAHDWSVDIRLPNGQRPNLDDSHLDGFYGHYLAAVDPDGGVHRWDWENNAVGLYVPPFTEPEAIALYDDRVLPCEPTRGPSRFLPEAGEVVFRSDWSTRATYLLLRGEHGPARERGLAHEHPDETSFILYAGGELLALDGGYIDFSRHDRVNQGRNHNLILVDGTGPPLWEVLGQVVGGGNDAYLEDFFASSHFEYAEVQARYGSAEIRRRVAFVDHSHFLVADQVRGDREHLYEWRLHGNGGGTSGGTYARTGTLACWQREQAELFAFLPDRPGRIFAEVDTIHSLAYLQELTHTVLRVQQRGRNATFLAALYPNPVGQVSPRFETLTAEGVEAVQILGEGGREVAWVLAPGADSMVLETAQNRVESDGQFGLAQYAEQCLRGFAVQDGRFLRIDGEERFRADAEIDVALILADTLVQGFVRGPESGFALSLSLPAREGAPSFSGSLRGWSAADQRLSLELAGEGELRIPLSRQRRTADFDGSGRVDLADFFLFADVFGLPATGDLAHFDLDQSGRVDLADFFLFADDFGR